MAQGQQQLLTKKADSWFRKNIPGMNYLAAGADRALDGLAYGYDRLAHGSGVADANWNHGRAITDFNYNENRANAALDRINSRLQDNAAPQADDMGELDRYGAWTHDAYRAVQANPYAGKGGADIAAGIAASLASVPITGGWGLLGLADPIIRDISRSTGYSTKTPDADVAAYGRQLAAHGQAAPSPAAGVTGAYRRLYGPNAPDFNALQEPRRYRSVSEKIYYDNMRKAYARMMAAGQPGAKSAAFGRWVGEGWQRTSEALRRIAEDPWNSRGLAAPAQPKPRQATQSPLPAPAASLAVQEPSKKQNAPQRPVESVYGGIMPGRVPGKLAARPSVQAPFSVEEYHPASPALAKSASAVASARMEVSRIMDAIYRENPEYWPYGLDIAGHDGGVYLVRDNATRKAAGFVGWQERVLGGRKVGLYSIGILPEFRKQGLAREAVAKIIGRKAAGVDEVRAFIVPGNAPSHALAASLDVPVMHKAAASASQQPDMAAANMAAAAQMAAPAGIRMPGLPEETPPQQPQNAPQDAPQVLAGSGELQKLEGELVEAKAAVEAEKLQHAADLESSRIEAQKQQALTAVEKEKMALEVEKQRALAEVAAAAGKQERDDLQNALQSMRTHIKQAAGDPAPFERSTPSGLSVPAWFPRSVAMPPSRSAVEEGMLGRPPYSPDSSLMASHRHLFGGMSPAMPTPYKGRFTKYIPAISPIVESLTGGAIQLAKPYEAPRRRTLLTLPAEYLSAINDYANDPRLASRTQSGPAGASALVAAIASRNNAGGGFQPNPMPI